jgi:hypothetical protein
MSPPSTSPLPAWILASCANASWQQRVLHPTRSPTWIRRVPPGPARPEGLSLSCCSLERVLEGPTRIWHVHPAATIQPRSKLAQVSSRGAQRAAGDRRRGTHTRVPATRSEASHCQRMLLPDDSGIEEERAGGGPEQEDRACIRADDVYLEYWRSTH